MGKRAIEEKAATIKEEKVKAKPGRKPMTPEEKAAAAEAREIEKAKAANLKPDLILQYQGDEISMDTLVDAARADFHQEKKRTLVTDLKLYVKPEERAAYYVINGDHEGKIEF